MLEVYLGMNINNLFSIGKAIEANLFFNTNEGKIIALQIKEGQVLAKHLSKTPAVLLCISGKAIYEEENGRSVNLNSGDYCEIPENVLHWVSAEEISRFLLMK